MIDLPFSLTIGIGMICGAALVSVLVLTADDWGGGRRPLSWMRQRAWSRRSVRRSSSARSGCPTRRRRCTMTSGENATTMPAPTPSGDAALAQVADIANLSYESPSLVALVNAIRAESAATLQEAREGWRLANEAAERLLPIANRAESAEQRLREVVEAVLMHGRDYLALMTPENRALLVEALDNLEAVTR